MRSMRTWLYLLAAGLAACGGDSPAFVDGGPLDATSSDGTDPDATPDAPVDAGTDANRTPQTFFGNNATDQNAGGMFPQSGSAAKEAHDALVARLAHVATETFETSPVGVLPATGNTAMIDALAGWGGGGSRLVVDNTTLTAVTFADIQDVAGFGRFNTTPGAGGTVGDGRWFEASAPFTLTLAAPSHAFGMYVTDAGDFNSTLRVELFLGAAAVGTLDVPPIQAIDGNLAFYGRVDPEHPFDRVVVTIVQPQVQQDSWDRIGFDDLVIGTVD